VLGGRIYIPGGRTRSGANTDVLEIYDPRLDAWQEGAALPLPLSAYALATFEGRLYLFGGKDGGQVLNSAYRYDPAQDAWEALPDMPTRRAYAGAAVAGREIYVLGGTGEEGTLSVTEIFAPDRLADGDEAWSNGVPMPERRWGMGAASVADTIYVMGGAGEALQFPSLAFFPQSGEWQSLEAPPESLGGRLVLVSLGTSLFALGGETGTKPLDNNLAYKAMYTISIPLITK
jgi:N-acetylneuraminic acid mutarotase